MANIHKCGNCGSILKSFKDDCQVCLGKEKSLPEDKEYELLFSQEREARERAESLKRKLDKYNLKHGISHSQEQDSP